PTTRGSSAACHKSSSVSVMSRELRNRPPLSRSAPVDSGGTLRRSSDSTIEAGSGLDASGPQGTKAIAPPIESQGKKPTWASSPTMTRRMVSPPFELGSHQIGPKRPDRVKHRACRLVEPIVAHYHGRRHAADRA